MKFTIRKLCSRSLAVSLSCILFFCQQGSSQVEKNVTVTPNKATGFTEIRNGLLGVVIPGETAKSSQRALAPIQSFIYSDGEYSDNTVNYLQTKNAPVSMRIQMLTRTPEEVAVQLEYRFQKEKYEYGKQFYKGGESGPGFYRCLIKIRKGEKTILVEEDTDYDIVYSVKISNGLSPDKARYRGWQSASAQLGYEPGGGIYRSEDQRRYPLDATVDLDYKKTFTYPRLILWEPAGGEINSGRYWQIFNSRAGNNANLIGFFQGKPSRLLGAKFIGPSLQVSPEDEASKEKNIAELAMNTYRRGPDNSWVSRKRFQWAIFISTKKELLSPEKDQPIGRELNRVSGLGAVISDYSMKQATLVPAFYKGAIYQSADKIAGICKKVKRDAAFYQQLYDMDSWYRPIWNAWRYPDSARSLARQLLQVYDQIKKQYLDGEGTYHADYRYWKGALNFKYYAIAVSCLFADGSINISPADKKKLEQLVVLLARIVWNDNNVPLFDSAGVNFGPANMAIQYRNNSRIFFALLLANDPEFSGRAKKAVAMINEDVEQSIYTNGASFGTPHYTQATLDPLLFSLLQLKQAGVADLFRTNKKIIKFARFYSSLLTPPSCRFQHNRKLISFGDGSEESSPAFALLATGLEQVDPRLSEQLYSQFYYGPPRFDITGPTGLAIDLAAVPGKIFRATTCNYNGYVSHFRSGLNTSNETAVWVLNGDSLFDHRNDDAGQVAIYALQAPVSLSGSSFYYPHATDSRVKGVVVPESMFPEWKEGNQPIGERSLSNRTWPSSKLIQFASMGRSASTTVKMSREGKEWFRKISMLSFFEENPIIVFYDSITGRGASIWSLPMMSAASVNTPAGTITPVQRIHNNNDKKELPQATAVKRLSPGINEFLFTGQQWPAHPTQGINWKLYTRSDEAMDFTMARWTTTWQNTLEQQEFLTTNRKNYQEEQLLIRLRSDQPFFNVLLPYKKEGGDPYARAVRPYAGSGFQIEYQNDDMIIAPGFFGIRTSKKILACLLSEQETFNNWGITVAGGYTEVEYDKEELAVRVHGNTGIRKVTVPQAFIPKKNYPGVTFRTTSSGSSVTINYAAGTKNVGNEEVAYTEYIFKRK